MIIMKRSKNNKNLDDIKTITRSYIAFLQGYSDMYKFSDNEIIELFRYVLCISLDLETSKNFNNKKFEAVIDTCKMCLRPQTIKFCDKSKDFKRGLVQGCIHCIVASFDKVSEVK